MILGTLAIVRNATGPRPLAMRRPPTHGRSPPRSPEHRAILRLVTTTEETDMLRLHRLPRGWASSLVVVAFCAAAPGAFAQPEISGGANAATGGPVPKSISVPQARLDAADKDGRNY